MYMDKMRTRVEQCKKYMEERKQMVEEEEERTCGTRQWKVYEGKTR